MFMWEISTIFVEAGLSPSKKNCFYLLQWKHFKMTKTAFCFMLKTLSVIQIFEFLPWRFWSYYKNAKVNFKIYYAIDWTMKNIFPRSYVNQTVKFEQLIKYDMRNTFLEKSCTKCCRKANLRPFYQKSKLRISLDQQREIL